MTPNDLERDATFETPRATVFGLSLPFISGATQSEESGHKEPAYPDERDGVFETHR